VSREPVLRPRGRVDEKDVGRLRHGGGDGGTGLARGIDLRAVRWYERFVPVANQLYDEHLLILRREGLL